jgi:hypothetical protein
MPVIFGGLLMWPTVHNSCNFGKELMNVFAQMGRLSRFQQHQVEVLAILSRDFGVFWRQ